MKKAFYPPLIAIFLVLALFNANTKQLTSSSDVIVPLLISLGIAGAIWIVLRLVLKSWSRAALPTCLLTIMCLEYGHFRGALGLNEDITLAIWVSVFTIGVLLTMRIRRIPTRTFNIIACILVLVVLIPFGNFVLSTPTTLPSSSDEIVRTSNSPDIYYIIIDEYGRDDALLDVCNFDNSEFTNYLRDKGFHISDDYANYPVTGPSLASSLNMDYLPKSDDDDNPYTYTRNIYNLIQSNEVSRQLKQRGYTIINIGSVYCLTAHSKIADFNYRYSEQGEFSRLFYKVTILYNINVFYTRCTTEREYYNHTIYQFEALREVPKMSEPTFTFVHVLIAHTPFVFNADGSFRGKFDGDKDCTPELFMVQLRAANSMLRKTVDGILNRDSDAIIIIQGDTGFYPQYHDYTANIEEESHVLWARLANINAVRAPECNAQFTSPVNTFRYIFNQYFDTDYEILPDRYFWATQFVPPFETYEVTDILRGYEKEVNK